MPQHLIMAGPTRTGTTSLFRFLGSESRIGLSRKKETDYFYRIFDGSPVSREDYLNAFGNISGKRYALEASPLYFMAGQKIARSIKDTLDGAKVIIILRNPIDRFFSIYGHIRDKRNLGYEADIEQYFFQCLEYDPIAFTGKKDINSMSFHEGAYVDLLEAWVDIIGPENTFVTFYEFLFDTDRQQGELARLFAWLGLENSPLVHSRLSAENIGRNPPSSRFLHRMALRANDRIEPFLNTQPLLRSALRSLYYAINTQSRAHDIRKPEIEEALALAYNETNKRLAGILEKMSLTSVPRWVYGTPADRGLR